MREGDAAPDEIAIIPDQSRASEEDELKSPSTPGGKPIPKTMVEEPADTDGSQTHAEKKHRADPPPDLIMKADGKLEDGATGTSV